MNKSISESISCRSIRCGLILLFLISAGQLSSKNVIKIATIGHRPPVIDASTDPQVITDKMIEFWGNKFAQVLPDRPDLIVVPEICDQPGGFPQEKLLLYYQVRKNQIRDYFASVARENRCYIVYSAVREMQDKSLRNSSVLLDREGNVAGIYNKCHPTIGEMDRGILCGVEPPIIQCDFGRVALLICFDLNFDEIRLRYVKAKPDLLIFSSMYHGGLMQAYWAYSCRAFFVGAISSKPSEIRNPMGDIIAASTDYFDFAVADVNLDSRLVHLDYNWERLRALKKKYGRDVTMTDPGFLGAVLITSEHETIPIDDMTKEFQIELLDDYLNRSLAYRHKPGNME